MAGSASSMTAVSPPAYQVLTMVRGPPGVRSRSVGARSSFVKPWGPRAFGVPLPGGVA